MSEQSRRNILKSIALGGGIVTAGKVLPDGWKKPVVDTVILPSHAATTACVPCLEAADFCEGQGEGSMRVNVVANGTVMLYHNNGTGTDTVDPCGGDQFSIAVTSTGGGTITVSGTIPCGFVESILVTETSNQGSSELTLTRDNCLD